MLIGHVSLPYHKVISYTKEIKKLKLKHNFYGEIKWTKVSKSKLTFYMELIDFFFNVDIRYRAIIINKAQINNTTFSQDNDTFYYKMYYQLLNHNKNSYYTYNVFLDLKDDLSAQKVNKLKDILNIKFGVFRTVQNIKSHESILLQLADFITGALSYNLNSETKTVIAKKQIIEKIKQKTGQQLIVSSQLNEKKLNLFFIKLQ